MWNEIVTKTQYRKVSWRTIPISNSYIYMYMCMPPFSELINQMTIIVNQMNEKMAEEPARG